MVVENNLTLALDRGFIYSAQADLLRTKSGQAARGVAAAGATVSNTLFSSAIGAGVGAGAGTTAQGVTRGQQVRLNSEQVLNFQLQSPLTVTPASGSNRDRQRLEVQ